MPHRVRDADAQADAESVVDAEGVGDADLGVGKGKEALGDKLPDEVGVYALDTTVALDVGDCAVCDAGVDGLTDGDADSEPLPHTLTVALPVVDVEMEKLPVGDCDVETDVDDDSVALGVADAQCVADAHAAIVVESVCVHEPDGERLGVGVIVAHSVLDPQLDAEALADTHTVVEVDIVIVGESENEPVPLLDCDIDRVSEGVLVVHAD